MARVLLGAEAAKDLEGLELVIHRRVLAIIERLQKWPNVAGAKPLRGALSARWRIRTGDFRVQFYVIGDDVIIEKIGHRDGFYND